MTRIQRTRKIIKARTRRELENMIIENVSHGWKQISDIQDGYGNYGRYQVLLEFTTFREGSK